MYLIAILGFLLSLIVAAYVFSIKPLNVSVKATKEHKIKQLEKWLESLYSKGRFQGVILLANEEGVIFSKGYGFADDEEKKPLTKHSSFNLASVSKQFTAAGVILLNHEGKLSYSDELKKYIPELSFYRGVTIRHLLSHTSGIPDYFSVANEYIDESEIVTSEKLIKAYSEKHPRSKFNPGDKFEYSNMGYVLLAEIIARASGKSYASFMSEHLFQPLNMRHTRVFNLLSKAQLENRVYGFKKRYFLFGKKLTSDLNRLDGVAGDGGIYSSAYDLYLWHQALQSGSFVSASELSEAYKSGLLNNGRETGYGFGWFVNDDWTIEHAGGWQGFATYLYRNPENGHLIVVLDNTGNILRVTTNGMIYNSIPLNLQRLVQVF